MEIEIIVELYEIKHLEILSKAMEPDNTVYKHLPLSKVLCKAEKNRLICKISGSDILKVKGLFNDLTANLYAVMKSLEV